MMKSQKTKIVLIIFSAFSLLILFSCNKNTIYSKYQSFDKYDWYRNNKAIFETEITDLNSLHDINLMVRHTDAYPYSNLFLFLTTKYPDGKIVTDTLECVLSNSKGEWLGNGGGDIFDLSMALKKNLRFPLAGKYQFTFEQGMRTDPLPLIMDFGMEIKKVSGN